MSEQIHYSILFDGGLMPGFDEQKVIKNIRKVTPFHTAEIKERFFNDKTVLVKKTTNLEKAKRYHNKFLRCGASVWMEMDFIVSTDQKSAG